VIVLAVNETAEFRHQGKRRVLQEIVGTKSRAAIGLKVQCRKSKDENWLGALMPEQADSREGLDNRKTSTIVNDLCH